MSEMQMMAVSETQVVSPSFFPESTRSEGDLGQVRSLETRESLRALPNLEEIAQLPDAELKKLSLTVPRDCFLCEKIHTREKLEEDERWHLRHCLGSTLLVAEALNAA